MKPTMRTKEWLVEARRIAHMDQKVLRELAGFGSPMTISYFETGKRNPTKESWETLEALLRPHAPLLFVDEDELIAKVKAGAGVDRAGLACRLVYSMGKSGLVFTDVASVDDEEPSEPYIPIARADAVNLLTAQKSLYEE